jgi:hypothetical protein
MSRENVTMLFSLNNIEFKKCELYSDFVQSLFMIIFDTYLGDDVTNREEQILHFKWCWDKNLLNFSKEGISFKNPKLYNYFLEFMLEVFYSYKEKKIFEYTDIGILNIWVDIFDYNKTKTNADADTLIEIYQIFNSSLKTM